MFRKICEYRHWRVYRFDKSIRVGKNGELDCGPTDCVVVSDAAAHTERLVFPLYVKGEMSDSEISEAINSGNASSWFREERPEAKLQIDFAEIEGAMTMMIDGGDPDTIEPDEAYLLRLEEMNGGGKQ